METETIRSVPSRDGDFQPFFQRGWKEKGKKKGNFEREPRKRGGVQGLLGNRGHPGTLSTWEGGRMETCNFTKRGIREECPIVEDGYAGRVLESWP